MIIDVAFLAWSLACSQPAGGARPASCGLAAGARQEAPAQPAQAAGDASRFNPAISVIPDVVYYNDNRDGSAAELISDADGFARHAAGGGHAHGAGLERGFNLREVEVAFSGAVDPYFDAWAILAIGDGEIEAEEVYVQTRALAPGLQVRAGKFYSGIGYLNGKHPHQWDFVDAPLPYSHLLGGTLNEVGLQVTWLPSLPVYVLFGGELLQGANEAFAQQLGPSAAEGFPEKAGPRLLTGFVKVSPNLGDSHTLQVGGSVARARVHQEFAEGQAGDEPLDGTGTLVGADVVYQYDSGRQWGVGDITVQGEYFRRRQDLDGRVRGRRPRARPHAGRVLPAGGVRLRGALEGRAAVRRRRPDQRGSHAGWPPGPRIGAAVYRGRDVHPDRVLAAARPVHAGGRAGRRRAREGEPGVGATADQPGRPRRAHVLGSGATLQGCHVRRATLQGCHVRRATLQGCRRRR